MKIYIFIFLLPLVSFAEAQWDFYNLKEKTVSIVWQSNGPTFNKTTILMVDTTKGTIGVYERGDPFGLSKGKKLEEYQMDLVDLHCINGILGACRENTRQALVFNATDSFLSITFIVNHGSEVTEEKFHFAGARSSMLEAILNKLKRVNRPHEEK